MKILAIDPGFGRVGVAVIDISSQKEQLLFSECIETSADTPFAERVLAIGDEIEQVISRWGAAELAIETLLFNKNQKTAMQVAEARGVILYLAAKHGLSIHEYTPLQIKIAVTGHGAAPKAQVESMTRALITIDKVHILDDEMDAIAIGLTHSASRRHA